ncbi:MAG: DUF1549 domain-containing protein [Verrucomicrobia bacterium]|nr:DUF1549 domain-containing protein [Verrucomicrobiota bacterium]
MFPLLRIRPAILAAALLCAGRGAGAAEAKPTAEQTEFFEKKIRPLLIENCYECHSQQKDKSKGGLQLDTRAALLKGGDTGPAVVPGEPDKSLLIHAVRYTHGDLKMPPKDKRLAPEKIADLEAWVKMGAPDPRSGGIQNSEFRIQNSKKHWAFQPVQEPPLPAVKNQRWVQSPVDAFVLAKLEARGWTPSVQADKRTLIRRVTFDLIGLPPTPEEVAAFVADRSPDAYTRLVDRLLTSPRYGERWGRYWLDVARYADTKGYVGNEESRYPFAYTYRDYVIRAFNEDLPYDQFILQQIAADQLKLGDDNRPLAALGFLTLGRRFINSEPDIIDDRLDVICRGTMALTISCARCHDHKFDPIPTKDYYSLYGVLKSCNEPKDKPLLQHQPVHPEYTNFVAELARRQGTRATYISSNEVFVLNKLRREVGDYLQAIHDTKDFNDPKRDEEVRGKRKLNMGVHKRWDKFLADRAKTNDALFTPWRELSALTNDFTAKAKDLAAIFAANNNTTNKLNPLVAKIFTGLQPTNLAQVAQAYGKLFTDVEEHWQLELKLRDPVTVLAQGQTNPPPPTALADANEEALRQVLYADGAPPNPPRDQFGGMFLFDDAIKGKIEEMTKAVAALEATHPGAPPRAMALADNDKPKDVKVFVRGDPGTQGEPAPRRFLEIASGANRALFPTNASGRLQLAQAIVSRDNPLTARVLVNRVWLNHFGAPLVRTPSDFGIRAEAPEQLDLLNHLAARFMADGWSVKKLHRLILLSSTYQQSSADNPACTMIDPENKFLWRANRRRLDFEALRDSLLAVADKLDLTAGGQPVDIVANMASGRRTIYSYVDRQDLPNLFRIFDFANPDASSPQRFETIVAPQALYLLNSPFMIDRVKNVAGRARKISSAIQDASLTADQRRVRAFYQLVYQREPTPRELQLGSRFFLSHPPGDVLLPEVTAWQYGYGAYDAKSEQVTNFIAFTKFTGKAWQTGDKMPDEKFGHLFLDAEGGHPGITNTLAPVRRWVAPHDGHVSIRGEFSHGSTNGDGVRATIVSSRTGRLGQWIALNNKVQAVLAGIEVRKGERLDFATDCIANNSNDTFKWAPIIEMTDAEPMVMTGQPTAWDAKQNFADPKNLPKTLNAWEEYAQVLLLANEFAFVD